jgi:excinuclease ABC subunit B
MGIATWHEFAPANRRAKPRKPTLDEMGPGVEAVPAKPRDASSPRSTLGRPGMRGGWKPRRR